MSLANNCKSSSDNELRELNSSILASSVGAELPVAEVIDVSRRNIEANDYEAALQIIDHIYSDCGSEERLPLDGLKADCYVATGEFDSALDCYQRILDRTTAVPYWVHVGYGNALERKGENDKAVEQMCNALEQEFSIELIKRVMRLSQFTSAPAAAQDAILEISMKRPVDETTIEVAELLILQGQIEKGSKLFEHLITKDDNDLTIFKRMVKSYIELGESKLAINTIESWQASNPKDTRLDRIYNYCLESRILDTENGLPCFMIEAHKPLSDYRMCVNGYEVRDGLTRYSRLLPDENESRELINRYLIQIPQSYVDTNSEYFELTISELTENAKKYSCKYPTRSLVSNENELSLGDFEYLGGNRIHGWFKSKIYDVDRLTLYINGEYMQDVKVNLIRPDVRAVHGEDYLESGFECSWELSQKVYQLELRDPVADRPVLGTPIKVQHLELAVKELEKALPKAVDDQSACMTASARARIFRSLREMPHVSVDFTENTATLLRNYADGLSIIIPVYNGLEDVKRCITSILESESTGSYEVVCVNDCSPDKDVEKYLSTVAEDNSAITLINSEVNRGFVSTVNKGLVARAYKDVVILNSDTVVPNKFVDRMVAAAEFDSEYGVITPLSNNATIYSFPLTLIENSLSSLDELTRIDNILQENAEPRLFEMPTGHGYCMYVRGEVLEDINGFDEQEWGIGYGEENDFCQKVKMNGWKIGAYHGMYVGHTGSVSFGEALRDEQIHTNLQRLNVLYPDYEKLVHGHIHNELDSRLDRNLLQIYHWNSLGKRDDVLFVTHSLGGGTTEYINRCTGGLKKESVRSLVLTTRDNDIVLCDQDKNIECVYRLNEIEALVTHLKVLKIADIILNSTFNFPSTLFDSLTDVANGYTVVIHDYSWLCPRVNLIDARGSYCGMPSSEVCVKCVEVSGTHESVSEDWKNVSTGLDLWLTRNKAILEKANQIIAPSEDAANRLSSKYPSLEPVVKYHSDTFRVPDQIARYKATRIDEQVIGVFGMIGNHKGMKLFQKLCWFLSSRHPGIQIVFFGSMSETEWMSGYPNVKCVGEYDKESLPVLIEQEKPTASLFFSMWPETYCYALTDSIQHGVYPIAFDLGAFPERMKMHNYGTTIPFDTDPEKVAQSIINVMSSDDFNNAKVSQIKNGTEYPKITVDYFDVTDIKKHNFSAVG